MPTHSSHPPARRDRAFTLDGKRLSQVPSLTGRAVFSLETVAKFSLNLPAHMSSAAAVTDASFEQDVLQSDVPVLVDCWAPWCGPCRMVAPIVEEIAKEFDGQIKVFKLNTDENPNVASQYGIRSIPTLMVFKGGQKVDTVVGAVPKATLSGTISKYL